MEVILPFTDLQTGLVYNVGDTYPAVGEASENRLLQLTAMGYIKQKETKKETKK